MTRIFKLGCFGLYKFLDDGFSQYVLAVLIGDRLYVLSAGYQD